MTLGRFSTPVSLVQSINAPFPIEVKDELKFRLPDRNKGFLRGPRFVIVDKNVALLKSIEKSVLIIKLEALILILITFSSSTFFGIVTTYPELIICPLIDVITPELHTKVTLLIYLSFCFLKYKKVKHLLPIF